MSAKTTTTTEKKSAAVKENKTRVASKTAAGAKGAARTVNAAGKSAAALASNTKAKPANKVNKKAGKEKKSESKIKVVRDSFSMPRSDYDLIASLKEACLGNSIHVKKSELLRAGLQMLSKLNATQLQRAIAALEPIKTGRPKKTK